MPPTFQDDDLDDHDWDGDGQDGDGVRVLRSCPAPTPALSPQVFRLPPLRRRPPRSARSAPSMLLRRPRRWLQLTGGTVLGLAVGLLLDIVTR